MIKRKVLFIFASIMIAVPAITLTAFWLYSRTLLGSIGSTEEIGTFTSLDGKDTFTVTVNDPGATGATWLYIYRHSGETLEPIEILSIKGPAGFKYFWQDADTLCLLYFTDRQVRQEDICSDEHVEYLKLDL